MINYSIQQLKDVPDQLDWLHPSELELFRKFRFEKRQNDWILGRWTAKNLLKNSWFNSHRLDDIAILPGENRAPLVYINGEIEKSRISISHSHKLSLCVTTREDMEIGCDLEKAVRRSEAFISDYFSGREHELASQYKNLFSSKQFYTLCWSAKEALMKATRKGFSLHPKKIELSDIKLSSDTWNQLKVKNLRSDEVFQGLWKVEKDMVFVIVGREVNLL